MSTITKLRKTATTRAPRVLFYKGLAKEYPATHVKEAAASIVASGEKRAFHITDLNAAKRQANLWQSKLPWIVPHYAIKSNASKDLLKLLYEEGVAIDVASGFEMDLCEGLGVKSESMIYSNPCKMTQDITRARALGIDLTVYDSLTELDKVMEFAPDMNVLLRIKTSDQDAQVKFSHRFGAARAEWYELLAAAKEVGATVRGVSFHVGSGVSGGPGHAQVFERALIDAQEVFALGREMGHRDMDTVDVGGGFAAESSLDDLVPTLARMREEFGPKTRWIAEPGRFMSASTQTAACCVIASRGIEEESGVDRECPILTVNDTSYGTFSCIPYDHSPIPECAPVDINGDAVPSQPTQVFGCSCDGYDVISRALPVPKDVRVGDWFVFSGMGAYTQVSRSNFNGIQPSIEFLLKEVESQQRVEKSDWAEGQRMAMNGHNGHGFNGHNGH